MAAASNTPSLSDFHALYSSSPPLAIDNDQYRTMVLRSQKTESEVDQHFLKTAVELGIHIPRDPGTTLDIVAHGLTGLRLNGEPSTPALPSLERASQSIHTASDSSIEHSRHVKTPSLAATSITSVSSVASHTSDVGRVRKGFRRISKLHKRKVLPDPALNMSSRASSMLQVHRPGALPVRSMTTDQIPTISDDPPHAITTDQIHTATLPRSRMMSAPYIASPPPTVAPPPPPEEDTPEIIASRQRSCLDPVLKELRATQLQEQHRFIGFEASQYQLLHAKQLQQRQNSSDQYNQRQQDIHAVQAEALTSLENRHLNAEVELHRTLQLERQACETRLKHMQAYCNPRSNVQGMPSRVVTKTDYRQLEQQYHVRNGMDNLHTSRINVLREKQAKQVERITAKQESELEALDAELELTHEDLDVKFQNEELQLDQDFAHRKARLVARWTISEAIERRRLELQTGEDYGPLPTIPWPPKLEQSDSRPATPVSSMGSRSPASSRDISRDEGFET